MAAERDRLLALAGLCQAAAVVQQLARRGWAEGGRFQTCLDSVLALDAPDTESVFGGAERVCGGLAQLRAGGPWGIGGADLERGRYVLAAAQLAGRLAGAPPVQARLRAGLADLVREPPQEEDALCRALGRLYSETLSTLPPRILVQGEPRFLQDPQVVARIRTALLAAVRAAYLWHQLGGRRWHWLFRRRLAAGAARLMAEAGCGEAG